MSLRHELAIDKYLVHSRYFINAICALNCTSDGRAVFVRCFGACQHPRPGLAAATSSGDCQGQIIGQAQQHFFKVKDVKLTTPSENY